MTGLILVILRLSGALKVDPVGEGSLEGLFDSVS